MDDIEKKLQNYKVAVKEAEMKVAQLQGSWDTTFQRVKELSGVTSEEEARKLLEESLNLKQKLGDEIQTLTKQVDEAYTIEPNKWA